MYTHIHIHISYIYMFHEMDSFALTYTQEKVQLKAVYVSAHLFVSPYLCIPICMYPHLCVSLSILYVYPLLSLSQSTGGYVPRSSSFSLVCTPKDFRLYNVDPTLQSAFSRRSAMGWEVPNTQLTKHCFGLWFVSTRGNCLAFSGFQTYPI